MKILTRCTRPENLFKMYDSLPPKTDWVIIFDTHKRNLLVKYHSNKKLINLLNKNPKEHKITTYFWEGENGDFGHTLINKCVELNPKHYYYMLDDDTLYHPNLSKINLEEIDHLVIVGDQEYSGGVRIAEPENMKVQRVDMGQFIIWGEYFVKNGGLRHKEYMADGYLIEKLYEKDPKVFYFHNEIISYYNKI